MSGATDPTVWLDAANRSDGPDLDPPPASSLPRIPSRLRVAVVLSLLAHGVLLSLALGGDGLGLPGLSFPWKERRLGADDLRIVLAPLPSPAPPPAPPAPAASAPAATAPVASPGRSAPVVLPPPPPAPVSAAPARPKVNLPVAPDVPATRASADTVAPEPAAGADDTAQKQTEQAARARAAEQARIEQQQDAQREAARLAAERQELARQEALRQEQIKASAAKAAEASAQLEAARQELARAEAARLETERKEATRQEQTKQEQSRQEQARQEQARQAQVDAAHKEQAQQEAARQDAITRETARQDALKQEAARQDAIKQAAARQDAANQEAARQTQAKQDQAQRERAEQEAKREERLRAIGQQMKQEAAQRDAPTTSSLRRGWLFGRADANADLVEYAQAMSRKIEMNMTFDMVREAVKQPHAQPVVTVAVRADGSVEKVTFVASSGVPAIDDAIRKVIDSQAPYGRFPPALARQYDVVEIRRTWVFDMAIRLQ